MKEKLKGLGMIGIGILGLYGIYKACVESAAWCAVLALGGIAKFIPDKDNED